MVWDSETRAWLRASVLRWVRPQPRIRFVIFSLGLSGSTLLVDLMDHHPDIHCASELLAGKRRNPRQYVENRALLANKPVFGWKLKPKDIEKPGELLRELVDQGWRVVHLRRDNVFRQHLSSLLRVNRSGPHHRKADGAYEVPRVNVDIQEMLEVMARKKSRFELEDRCLEGLEHLSLRYEKDLLRPERHQATVDRMCAYLGIESCPARTDLARTSKDNLEDMIDNLGEVRQALESLGAGHYLTVPV